MPTEILTNVNFTNDNLQKKAYVVIKIQYDNFKQIVSKSQQCDWRHYKNINDLNLVVNLIY